jgi:hypothetical protein
MKIILCPDFLFAKEYFKADRGALSCIPKDLCICSLAGISNAALYGIFPVQRCFFDFALDKPFKL